MKRFIKLITLTLALAILPIMALAETGSAAVSEGETYTLSEMLTYAMQDEYMAEAEYAAIMEAFGVNNPYANIMNAELSHQEELLPLFAVYGIAVLANTAAGSVVIPETLQETYEIGVQAEINNIAMYQAFLAQENVPDDVRAVFTELMNASESHLSAFTRNAEKTGTGLGNGQENGLNQTTVSGQGYGNMAAALQQSTTGNGYGYTDLSTQSRGMGNGSMAAAAQQTVSGNGYYAQNNENCETCDECALNVSQSRGGRGRN